MALRIHVLAVNPLQYILFIFSSREFENYPKQGGILPVSPLLIHLIPNYF